MLLLWLKERLTPIFKALEEKIGGIVSNKPKMEPTDPTSALVIFEAKGAPTPLSLITA